MKTIEIPKIRVPVNYVSPKKKENVAKHLRIAKATSG